MPAVVEQYTVEERFEETKVDRPHSTPGQVNHRRAYRGIKLGGGSPDDLLTICTVTVLVTVKTSVSPGVLA
ncbi:hypothetical protein V492_03785 [Pseudogymnoascus sp. VKM F-4246]|nr:hypothetical protein V492_03785 [Pseudogymnoascus sp. VKM F-4246]